MDEMTLCMQKIINKLHNDNQRIAELEVQNAALLALVRNIEDNAPQSEDEIDPTASWKLWVAGERCRALLADLDAKDKAE